MSANPNYPHDRGCGPYLVPDYAEVLIWEPLRRAVERVGADSMFDWCVGDHDPPDVPGLTLRRYWWGDQDAPEAMLPNLEFRDLHIWFYKYWGRGMSCNADWSELAWIDFYRTLNAAIEGSAE